MTSQGVKGEDNPEGPKREREMNRIHSATWALLLTLSLSANALGWTKVIVDGHLLGLQTGLHTSIAIDAAGAVHISYSDWTNRDVKYATNASGTWITSTVDWQGSYKVSTSVALDRAGKVHVGYVDWQEGVVKYATNAFGLWTVSAVDTSGEVVWNASMTLDRLDNAHFCHYAYAGGTQHELRYATNASGSWVTTEVDLASDTARSPSIALDSLDNAYISYQGVDMELKVATNVSGFWVTTSVDTAPYPGAGEHTSIAIDGLDRVSIGYSAQPEETAPKELRVAANASGSWVVTTVDSAWFPEGGVAIAADSSGNIHAGYQAESIPKALTYATNASGSWRVETVDAEPNTGGYPSIALDGSDQVHFSYRDADRQNLKYASNTFSCTDKDGDRYHVEGGLCGLEDCNDGDPAVHPGQTEWFSSRPECSDDVDNDCDGKIDLADPDCQDAPCSSGTAVTTHVPGPMVRSSLLFLLVQFFLLVGAFFLARHSGRTR